MGIQKEQLIKMQDRGYGFSDKKVCSTCFGDKYLSNLISKTGKKGCCSYCRYEGEKRKYKNVLPLDDVMPYIMETIKSELPSIFDVQNRDKRSLWFFYKMFMEGISKPVTDGFKGMEYKPTQVLTKFVQKKMKLHGIMYNSSHAELKEDKYMGVNGEECLVLFVDHQNCIDEGEKVNKKKFQLIMRGNPTQEITTNNY